MYSSPFFFFFFFFSWRSSMGVFRPLSVFLLVLLLALVTRFEPLFLFGKLSSFFFFSFLFFLLMPFFLSSSFLLFFFLLSSFLLFFFLLFFLFFFLLGPEILAPWKLDDLKKTGHNKQTNKQATFFSCWYLSAQGPDQAALVAFWDGLIRSFFLWETNADICGQTGVTCSPTYRGNVVRL